MVLLTIMKFMKNGRILALLGVAVLVYFAYSHYTSLIGQIAQQEGNINMLQFSVLAQRGAIDTQRGAIQRWKSSQEKLVEQVEELKQVSVEARSSLDKINATFAKHDLEKLSRKKPVAIQRIINRGTSDALRMLECASSFGSSDCPDSG